jgi:hypothetical protein
MKVIPNSISVVHKNSGKEILVNLIEKYGKHNSHLNFESFNVFVDFEIVSSKKCIIIDTFKLKKCAKELGEFFNTTIKTNARLCIEITDESWDKISEIKTIFDTNVKDFIYDYEKRAAEMPTWFEVWDFYDMGDYSINYERAIEIWREPLPEEKAEKVHVKSYSFWNSKIGNHGQEWNKDFGEMVDGMCNDGKPNSAKISEELAKKWINIHREIELELEAEAKKKEDKKVDDKKKEEDRISACLLKAKETNEPVELYSVFLSGTDIPRQFRDEDSDMGTLVTYINPDGTRKEKFHHAY